MMRLYLDNDLLFPVLAYPNTRLRRNFRYSVENSHSLFVPAACILLAKYFHQSILKAKIIDWKIQFFNEKKFLQKNFFNSLIIHTVIFPLPLKSYDRLHMHDKGVNWTDILNQKNTTSWMNHFRFALLGHWMELHVDHPNILFHLKFLFNYICITIAPIIIFFNRSLLFSVCPTWLKCPLL